jgi:cation diffusion facilitator CzcD-associated flavoprotein CzcO
VLIAIGFQLDPLVVLASGALGLATLGIIVVQAMAAVAIVVFFRRRGQGRYWKTLILPGIGAVGLFAAAVFEVLNFDTLMGISNPLVDALPWLIVATMLAGVGVGLWLRRNRPARYARLAESRLRPQERALPRPQAWTRRYCLIGAGPAGLAMGRRLLEEGVPFDWFEAGADVGGIWHADRPGSPAYETLVAVTSRHTLGYPDFPMPADYPDYPAWWQVRDYLRRYAEFYGLYDRITFGTAVTWAKPEGLGWQVTLTSGEFRFYDGVIAAPGTSWQAAFPSVPGVERFRGQLWHSARYTSPAELAGRRILVMGIGNSAADIACDAARAGATVFLSVRRGREILPRHVDGVPTDALLSGAVPSARSRGRTGRAAGFRRTGPALGGTAGPRPVPAGRAPHHQRGPAGVPGPRLGPAPPRGGGAAARRGPLHRRQRRPGRPRHRRHRLRLAGSVPGARALHEVRPAGPVHERVQPYPRRAGPARPVRPWWPDVPALRRPGPRGHGRRHAAGARRRGLAGRGARPCRPGRTCAAARSSWTRRTTRWPSTTTPTRPSCATCATGSATPPVGPGSARHPPPYPRPDWGRPCARRASRFV